MAMVDSVSMKISKSFLFFQFLVFRFSAVHIFLILILARVGPFHFVHLKAWDRVKFVYTTHRKVNNVFDVINLQYRIHKKRKILLIVYSSPGAD